MTYPIGTELSRKKGVVEHKGLVIARNVIVHISPNNLPHIKEESLHAFLDGHQAVNVKRPPHYISEFAMRQRLNQLKQTKPLYSLFKNNCEHLVTFLKTGTAESPQLKAAILLALGGMAVGALYSENKTFGAFVGGALVTLGGLWLLNSSIDKQHVA